MPFFVVLFVYFLFLFFGFGVFKLSGRVTLVVVKRTFKLLNIVTNMVKTQTNGKSC